MRKILPLVIILNLLSFFALAQDLDSLFQLLGQSKEDNKPIILNQISETYLATDLSKSLNYINESISLSQTNEDNLNLVEGIIIKSKILLSEEKYSQAINVCYAGIRLLDQDNDYQLLGKIYYQLSHIFIELEHYYSSSILLNKSITYDSLAGNYENVAEKYLSLILLASTHNDGLNAEKYFMQLKNINDFYKLEVDSKLMQKSEAISYRSVKRFDKVLEAYSSLTNTYMLEKDTLNQVLTTMDLAYTYSLIFNYQEAIKQYKIAQELIRQEWKYNFNYQINDSIAAILMIQMKYDEAISLLNENIKARNNSSLNTDNQYTYLKLGQLYSKAKDNNNAIKAYDNSLKLENNINNALLASDALIKLYEEVDQIKLAIYQNKYQSLLNQFTEKKYSKQLKASDLMNQVSINEAELKDIIIEEKSKPSINLYIFLFIIFILFSLIVITLRSRIRLQQKFNGNILSKNKEITGLNEEIEELNKNIEKQLFNRTGELQEELTERRTLDLDLKKALKRAEDANYVKNAFLANMSHEIRTPLNGIIGFASLLETELSLLENQELYEYADSITLSGERLMHLLNNIIDISRIEANDMTISLTTCNLNNILKGTSDLFRFKANEKGLKFNIKLEEDLPSLFVDEKSLSKICSDIIENSVKYTEKGFINIVSGFDDGRQEVFIKVKDTGIGIDEAYLPNVFEAFRQESLGYSRAYQGAGLGLPLAKRMIEMMNGRIEIESQKGVGTLVSIYFPPKYKVSNSLNQGSSNNESITEDEVVVVSSSKDVSDIDPFIFVVEDDRMNRLVIKKMIEKEFRYEIAEDGDITMKMIKAFHKKGIIFDIMLFDINLPSPWDGVKLMIEIRKLFVEYKDVPFIAQTAYAMSGDKERLLEAGFDDYIPKPINKNILINSIKNQLK